MGDSRKRDTPSASHRDQLPVEHEACGRRLESHGRPGDAGPDIPESKRRCHVGILYGSAVMRDSLPNRGGRALEPHLEETGMPENPLDHGGERSEQQPIQPAVS